MSHIREPDGNALPSVRSSGCNRKDGTALQPPARHPWCTAVKFFPPARRPLPVAPFCLEFLNVGAVTQHDAAQVAGGKGADDLPRKPFLNSSGKGPE